jgi:hypothetical protein
VFHYYIGLDLGQSSDYTALALLEEPVWIDESKADWSYYNVFWPERVEAKGWVSPSELGPRYAHNALAVNINYGRPAHPPLYLRHLERFELGTKYDEVIRRVKQLLLREPIRRRLRHTALLVDKTGVGAAVVDHFWAAGVRPLSISIHGGAKVIPEPPEVHGFRVPKRDLVSAVQVLLQNGRLKIAEGLELAPVLKKELLNFKVKIDPRTAHDSYEHWREGGHDDLVLATALAAWYREYMNAEVEACNVRRGGFSVRATKHASFSELSKVPRVERR